MNDLTTWLSTVGRPRILVIGDLMLDRYTTGPVSRVSPEAPALVLEADQHEARPGGAASVAGLLRALDADVSLAGVTGDDADGRVLCRLLEEAGVNSSAVLRDPDRPTTLKERFLGLAPGSHSQQILRVDRETRKPLTPALETKLLTTLAERIGDHQAILISDYSKGVCTPRLLAGVVAAAAARGIPVLIDPARIADYDRYRGADLLKPNRAQAELATGRKILSPDDGLAAGQELCRQFGLAAALVTLDRDGMVLARAEGPGECFPIQARAVYDITGAGDMVLAMVGLCRAAYLPLQSAARLANVAAGIQVDRLGVAPVARREIAAALQANTRLGVEKEVTPQRLAALGDDYRRAGKRIAFTNGCFDLLHAGHLACLEQAARQADVLVVAVNSDQSVRRLKGPSRPVIGEADRASLLAALECVDHVVVFDDATPHRLLAALRPDVLVKGGTYAIDGVVGREVVEAYGGRICVTGAVEGVSTTRLLQRCLQGTVSVGS